MKKTFAFLTALVIAAGAFTGCADKVSSSDNGGTTLQSQEDSSQEDKAVAVTAPDVMAPLIGEGGSDFIGMDEKTFTDVTGGKLTKDTAAEYDEEGKVTYARYSLGTTDTMLSGRVKLPKEYDISATVTFEKGKLKKYTEKIDKLTMEETDAIFETFLKAFDGKLPEGYKEFTPVEHGKLKEVGFTRTTKDLVVSMKRDENLDGDIYLYFAIENYAERYNMK